MKPVSRSVILVAVLFCNAGLAPHSFGQVHDGDWQVHARFFGRVVGVSLKPEDLPTLPVGYDPHYQMRVEILTIHEGSLPVQPGGTLAFLIHSPSLFFMKLVGKKPPEFEGFIEGPFEFTIVRKPSGEGGFAYDLRIEPPAAGPSAQQDDKG